MTEKTYYGIRVIHKSGRVDSYAEAVRDFPDIISEAKIWHLLKRLGYIAFVNDHVSTEDAFRIIADVQAQREFARQRRARMN